MARYRGLTLRVLGKRAPAMGPGKAELIERIGETGSISAAASRFPDSSKATATSWASGSRACGST